MKKSYLKYDVLVDYEKVLSSYKDVVRNTEHKEKLFKYNFPLFILLIIVTSITTNIIFPPFG